MKKLALSLLCLFFAMGVSAQSEQTDKKWELRLGYEQPSFLKTSKINCETFRPSPRGVSLRGLYEAWERRLSVGAVLGYNEKNYVSEDFVEGHYTTEDGTSYTITNRFHNSLMYRRFYADAMLRFNVVNRGGFLLALTGSGGYEFEDAITTKFLHLDDVANTYTRETMTEKGSEFNAMFGAELGYELIEGVSVSAEYKYDIRESMHLLGLGVSFKL